MKLSVEISMYPLAQPFAPPIGRFIERLRGHAGLDVTTRAMSTEVSGEYDLVFDVLREEMRRAHAEGSPVVFVVKCIPGGAPDPEGSP